MLIRNEATGRLVDNNLNEQGERRMSVVQCYDVAHQINNAMLDAERALRLYEATLDSRREWQDRYSETIAATDAFVRFLGDNVRQHAIDNDLCANYERFLTGVVGEYVANDETPELAQNLAKTFVIYSSRARNLTVKTYNTVSVVGRSVYDVSAEAARLADEQASWQREAEITKSTPIHNYDECQARNESYARRGNYNLIGADNAFPSNPVDGERFRSNGILYMWCSDCDVWHRD